MSETFTGILAGWDELITSHFGLRNSITRRTAARDAYKAVPVLAVLFDELFEKIAINFSSGTPSSKIAVSNWKLRQKSDISGASKSLEKQLEKRIANFAEACENTGIVAGLPKWYNQMPAASGYVLRSNRKNCVDLVYEIAHEKEYAFIELKTCRESGEPFFAACEILSYAFLYLFTRTDEQVLKCFEKADRRVLKAEKVHLVVLAPSSYYGLEGQPDSVLGPFEKRIDSALRPFAQSKVPGLEMSFEFRRFRNPISEDDVALFEEFDPAPYGERLPFES